jgi:hypothetical protein
MRRRRSAFHQVPGACAPKRPETFAQTILSLSFFACDKAADHTFRFGRHSGGAVMASLVLVRSSLLFATKK